MSDSDDQIFGVVPHTESHDTAFLSNLDLPPEITVLDSPIQFFQFFITAEILKSIVYMVILHPTMPNKTTSNN